MNKGRTAGGRLMLTITTLAVGAAGAAGQEDPDVAGAWRGTLVAGPQQLEIVFNLSVGDDGALTGTMDVPAQGATGIPLTTVTLDGTSLSLTFPVPGGGAYEGEMSDDRTRVTGTFMQAGQSFPMDLERSDAPSAGLARPQEPTEPFPYVVEEVRFDNESHDVTLAGTLTVPEGNGPFPAAVLVSGSGPQDRDESLMGHKPFLVLSDHLTRNGIAVLRYDDRGVGASSGDRTHATSEDYAADALAGVRHLVDDTRIAGDAIGIVGHSEGGLIGPMAATRSNDVAYVVMLAGPGVTGLEIIVEQGRLINAASGTPDEITEFNASLQRRLASVATQTPDQELAAKLMREAILDEMLMLSDASRSAVAQVMTDDTIDQTVAQMNSAWFRHFLSYDPRRALNELAVPVLALFGEKDLQVPSDQSADEVRGALARAGNADATIRIMPGLNHLFQTAETGSPAEYPVIEETFAPEALALVSDWIVSRFGATRTAGGS